MAVLNASTWCNLMVLLMPRLFEPKLWCDLGGLQSRLGWREKINQTFVYF